MTERVDLVALSKMLAAAEEDQAHGIVGQVYLNVRAVKEIVTEISELRAENERLKATDRSKPFVATTAREEQDTYLAKHGPAERPSSPPPAVTHFRAAAKIAREPWEKK